MSITTYNIVMTTIKTILAIDIALLVTLVICREERERWS